VLLPNIHSPLPFFYTQSEILKTPNMENTPSSSSSSSSSSSESSEPPKTQPDPKKSKIKRKDKKEKRKHSGFVNEHDGPRDEAAEETTMNPAYEPPPGSVPFDHSDVDFGPFDWDSIQNDEDVELWLVRVPDSIRPKNIENLKLDYPPSSPQSVRVGQFERKHAKYDVWSLGEGSREVDNDEAVSEFVGGEELKDLVCLLPRKRKDGKLFLAPKPISRRLVLCASPALPASSDASPAGPAFVHQNPQRHSYPKEFLKHRFMPYGSVSSVAESKDASPIDVEMKDSTTVLQHKKRSRESDTPRKSKKIKAHNIASQS